MPETVFIRMLGDGGKIRESYFDLYNMVEMWGYRQCLLNEVDFESDNVYVVTFKDSGACNTFSTAEALKRKCKVVLWHLEWPEWRNGNLEWPEWTAGDKEYRTFFEFEWADEVWVSDHWAHQMIRRFQPSVFPRCRYVFLGGHPDFGAQGYDDREFYWEGVHISYLTAMRGTKYEMMRQFNPNTFWAPNGWGQARHEALMHSRWGVNLHQGEMPVITPQRFMIFASYCLPILTEYCGDPSPYMVFQDALNHFQPGKTSVGNKGLRDEAIRHNYEMVTKRQTFKSEVDDAVECLFNPSIWRQLNGVYTEAKPGDEL